ncbi:unnamed protein product [Moneuplotes crassus]|uniref:Uncharacterized protein n=1 Tax=Euplotes crassus TaxID=5936 RepID=A0AAD1XLI5_EUPCR|nr:unnamed protein product [Moneuplotes crassus]
MGMCASKENPAALESRQEALKTLNLELIPDDQETEEALRNIKKEISDERVRYVFIKKFIRTFFKREVIEDPEEWIPSRKQPAESFQDFLEGGFNQVSKERKTIYISSLDNSIDDEFLMNCQKYCEAYFYSLPVVLLPYLSHDVLKQAKKWVPKDAYCMICILNTDLYSKNSDNFVFGSASRKNRTGVFSFARYNPKFYGEDHDMTDEELKDLILFRSIRVMIHEIGHMFGMHHCV